MIETICIKEIPNIFKINDKVYIGYLDRLVVRRNWCPLWGDDYLYMKSNDLSFKSKDKCSSESLLKNIIGNFDIKDYFKKTNEKDN